MQSSKISSECSAQRQVFHCKFRHQGYCCFAQRQVFHRKLRNQGCNFTRDEQVRQLPVVFAPHSLIIISRNLENLKRSQEHQRRGEESGIGYWALRTSRKFTTWVKYHFHQGFFFNQIRVPEIPNHPSSLSISKIFSLIRLTAYSVLSIVIQFQLQSNVWRKGSIVIGGKKIHIEFLMNFESRSLSLSIRSITSTN